MDHWNGGPTHVCPRCGEWWDVLSGEYNTWLVSAHDNEETCLSKVWTEAASEPICPLDTETLRLFAIIDA